MYPNRNETLSFDNKVAIVSGIRLDFRSVFSQNDNKNKKVVKSIKSRFVFYKTIVGNLENFESDLFDEINHSFVIMIYGINQTNKKLKSDLL